MLQSRVGVACTARRAPAYAGRRRECRRVRLLSLSPKPPPSPPFPGICFFLAHNFVVFQPHSKLNLLCDQRFHASTLFRFQTATAFYSSQYIVLREYTSHYAFPSERERIQGNGGVALRGRSRRLSWARVVALTPYCGAIFMHLCFFADMSFLCIF